MRCSARRRSRRASTILDLPIPGSPPSSTTWPSPARASAQRSSSRRELLIASDQRRHQVADAAPRSDPRQGAPPRPRNACTASPKPLTAAGGKGSSSKSSPSSCRVLAAMTTPPRPATCCRRAARFGVSPTTVCSWAVPLTDQLADHHQAGRDPDPSRQRLARLRVELHDAVSHLQSRLDRALGLVLVRLRPTEISEHAIAHIFRYMPAPALDHLGATLLISPDQLAHILGVEPRRQLGRAHQIDEHHGQLPPLRLAHRRRCRSGRGSLGGLGRRCRRGEGRDRLQEALSMAERGDAELPEIVRVQRLEDGGVNVVGLERLDVAPQAQPAQPCRNIQDRPPLGRKATRKVPQVLVFDSVDRPRGDRRRDAADRRPKVGQKRGARLRAGALGAQAGSTRRRGRRDGSRGRSPRPSVQPPSPGQSDPAGP